MTYCWFINFLRYDDSHYGPPPERWYPSRDYDRGGYSERERERPPSYSNDHYSSRYRFVYVLKMEADQISVGCGFDAQTQHHICSLIELLVLHSALRS